MMYLAATDEAVSAVLLTERDRRQMPIHYVSRSLQGAETNYVPMEKLTLALVHVARRLRSKGSGPGRLSSRHFNGDKCCTGALLAGLRIAMKMQVKDIHAFVDSKLVASQVEKLYEAKGEKMIKYKEKVLELAGAFNRFQITHIPRVENRNAGALSKLATVQYDHFSKEVLVEVLNECYVETQEVNKVVEEEGPMWMTQI
ncbi:reverse transcriptase domain-containing protein [Tanacetum coccineum]